MTLLRLTPAILLSLLLAFTQTAEAKEKRTHSGKLIIEQDDNSVLANSSEANREEQKVYGVLSMGLNGGFGLGGSVGYFASPDFVIALSVEGSVDFFFSSSSLQTLQFKRYFGNSFYGFAGPAMRQSHYSGTFADAFEGAIASVEDENVESINTNYEVNDMGIDMAIGNQWQWDHFTLGCDWIGWYEPLTITSEDGQRDTHYKDGTTKYEEAYLDDEYKNRGRLRLLNFYFGVSF